MIETLKNLYSDLEFIKGVVGSDVIAAYFRHDGTRVEGSDKINVQIQYPKGTKTIWWYWVEHLEDYVFVRVPVIESSAHELLGQEADKEVPDARYWRWIAPVLPGRIYGGGESPSNVEVDFLVFGYRPKALIQHFSAK